MSAPASWFCIRGGGDTYWRVELPAAAIGAKLIYVPLAEGHRVFHEPNMDGSFRWQETDLGAHYPDLEGAAVFTRPDQVRALHAASMAANGHRTVAEVDDNYLAHGLTVVPNLRIFDDKLRRSYAKALLAFDAVIFSTDYLAERYSWFWRKELRTRDWPELHVVGNHVNLAHWPQPNLAPEGAPLRIGWMGSPSHQRDVNLIYRTLKWALQNGHEPVLIGYEPAWAEPLGATVIPWVDAADYKRAAFPLDIALAPLETNDFNLAKTDVKLLEYAMSGCAVVASNMPVYNETIEHGANGFLAGSPEEFTHFTAVLARDPELRVRLAWELEVDVREERSIDRHAGLWTRAVCGGGAPVAGQPEPPPEEVAQAGLLQAAP